MDQTTPQAPQQQPTPEAPKSGGSLKWLMIVLVILVVAAAIYWMVALR